MYARLLCDYIVKGTKVISKTHIGSLRLSK